MKAIEWRSIHGGAWHLFIGSKSICNRGYSNGQFDAANIPPKKSNICKFCTKQVPDLYQRIVDITAFLR